MHARSTPEAAASAVASWLVPDAVGSDEPGSGSPPPPPVQYAPPPSPPPFPPQSNTTTLLEVVLPLLAFLAIVCPLLCYGYRRWRRRRRIQRIWQRHIADNSGSLNSDTARLNQYAARNSCAQFCAMLRIAAQFSLTPIPPPLPRGFLDGSVA